MQPTLFIMCGLPFSGKTTFAKQLSKEKGYPIVSIDDIRESLGFYWDRKEADEDDWKTIFETANNQFLRYLKVARVLFMTVQIKTGPAEQG